MQDKTMIIMEPTEYGSDERACLYLERSVFGIVSLLNMFNMAKNREYRLLLLDDDGGIITETISESYKLFRLPKNFSLNSDMYAELYDGERLVLAGHHASGLEDVNYIEECSKEIYEHSNEQRNFDGSGLKLMEKVKPLTAKEWAEETGQADLYNSATELLNKFRNNVNGLNIDNDKTEGICECAINTPLHDERCLVDSAPSMEKELSITKSTGEKSSSLSFWQSISDDFDELFMAGKREQILEGIFKNSMWSKFLSESGGMCFGKIYKDSSYSYGATPDIVALAVPVLSEVANENVLGKFASFVRASEYDDFGFMVLLQESESGRAIKIIKNKG